jgi:acetylornithine deacetylase/succinyl-diaminopimelate desuccinylase-like protein
MGAKGPYVAWLNALQAIIAVEGTLPCNILFLAEGEEILGSPTYRDFVEQYRQPLSKVDLSFCPSSTQSPDGTVTVGLGLKGMVVLELTASGDAWGYGPKNSVHSSTASLISSPPFRLAAALASMVDEEGRGCKVKGLEELWLYRKPLSHEEVGLLEKLAARHAGKDWREVIPLGGAKNVAQISGSTEGIEPLVNFLYGPTFNIAGLYSGFLGWESGTVPFITPGKASAMLDMRMVVDLPADEIVRCVQAHLLAHGFGDIKVQVFAAFDYAQTSLVEPAVQATLETIQKWGLEPVVWPIEAGGGPWTAVPNSLNVPCVRGGAIGGGGRSPIDEYMIIEGDAKMAGLADQEKYLVDLIYAVTEAVAAKKAADV